MHVSLAHPWPLTKDFEAIPNNAIRIIFNIKITDEVSVRDVSSIEDCHESLINRYYEDALISNNPLIGELFGCYKWI